MSQAIVSNAAATAATEAFAAVAEFAADVLRDGTAHAPALMLGLAALVVLPVLTFAAALLRPVAGRLAPSPAPRTRRAVEGCTWPASAFLEIDGRARCPITGEMVRIGREDDNEIRLSHKTVHRYHAVIHRTEDAEFFVRDLSTANGNGVIVNGRRTGNAKLANGDTLVLGDAVLKFFALPA